MSKIYDMKKGKEYEMLVEQLYKKLEPESNIKRNDKIFGHNSKAEREIDISIKRQIAGHEILIIVQAKDYRNKIDVNVVGEFSAVIQDVRANKGVLISAKGFTKKALVLAKSLNIDTFAAIDLKNPKWTIDLKIPVILSVFNGNYRPDFILEASQEYADLANSGKMPKAPPLGKWEISDDNGRTFYTIEEKFHFLISYGKFKDYFDGKEHSIGYDGDLTLFITEGVTTPLREFKFVFRVTKKKYYKYFNVNEFQGFISHTNYKISRVNVQLEGDEFSILNYEVKEKFPIDLSTWIAYTDSTRLEYPYQVEVVSLSVAMPSQSFIAKPMEK